MIELPEEALQKVDTVLPHIARSVCRELVIESCALAMEGVSQEEYMNILLKLGVNAGSAEPLDAKRAEKLIDSIDFDLYKLWDLPVDLEQWEPFSPLFDYFLSMVNGIDNLEAAIRVLLQTISMGLVVRLKQLENRFKASDGQTYEKFMQEADSWVKVLHYMNFVVKNHKAVQKYFAIRKAQYDAGKASGIRTDEAKLEFLEAAVEEARLLQKEGAADNPKEAARRIVEAWRARPHTATWFEKDDGSPLYNDPEQAISRAIAKAAIFPKRGQGRPRKKSLTGTS